ncbi:glutathione peroxidase [Marinobacter sp. X15-166B]|uniref:glutathione peroxidase n=1 Tax=Marinobacter sp. X15-166B TaxID=1897620 RepID=UPI00085CD91A|nr:glutathione peroxidase [Marinobacter sp. X15-166B]OEY67196.1 glutathione peroxidase [Marinobacter sp. X15-166B]
MPGSLYKIEVVDITGNKRTLGDYRDQVLLIVNTASKCGFTPQFEGLQALYAELKARGFAVLGFPCNQFMNQDPGTDAEISEFCRLNYQVDFPMFARIDVNGADTHPLFRLLKEEATGLLGSRRIKWNFTKFLVNRQGQVVGRYPPSAKPDALRADIEKLLQA